MDELTTQGIQALRGGDKAQARSLFLSALEKDPDNAQAWLWLSGAVDSEQDRLDCLEQVLRIDPNNQAAAKGVALLVKKGLVPAEGHERPAEEPAPQPVKSDQGGWRPEMPEAAPIVPAASISVTVPASQAVPTPSETPAAAEAAPEPPEEQPAPLGANEPAAESYKLPDTFFQPAEAAEEPFPGWMATFTPENGALPPAAPAGQPETAPAAAEAAPVPASTPAFVQAPTWAAPQATETPTLAAGLEETLFKIKPSLVTTVVVYGLGAIIFFVATMGVLIITNTYSVPGLIGLALVVILLLVMLVVLVWETISHLMTTYTFTNLRIYLEKGVLRRTHKSIPLQKIKSVTLRQGVLQKIIGLGHLTIHTETADGKEELTRLVDVSKARQILDRIEAVRGTGR